MITTQLSQTTRADAACHFPRSLAAAARICTWTREICVKGWTRERGWGMEEGETCCHMKFMVTWGIGDAKKSQHALTW